MVEAEPSHVIERGKQFQLSSMEHLDVETLGLIDIVKNDDTALIVQSRFSEKTLLHWAVNATHDLVVNITSLVNTRIIKENTEIEFVPEACVRPLEQIGFSMLSEWVDYWQAPLRSVEIEGPEGLFVRRIKNDEYTRASGITRACKGASRGYLGESTQWLKEWNEQQNSMVYVALLANTSVGVCCVGVYGFDNPDGPTMWLRELAVDPLYHSRRIGLSLMARALEWGVSQGAVRSFLACDAENKTAIRLYEGLGYKRASQRGQINMVYRDTSIARACH